MPSLDWRSLDTDSRQSFLSWVDVMMRNRQHLYGDEFQGDPLEQLIAGLLDALFLAWVAKRQRLANDV